VINPSYHHHSVSCYILTGDPSRVLTCIVPLHSRSLSPSREQFAKPLASHPIILRFCATPLRATAHIVPIKWCILFLHGFICHVHFVSSPSLIHSYTITPPTHNRPLAVVPSPLSPFVGNPPQTPPARNPVHLTDPIKPPRHEHSRAQDPHGSCLEFVRCLHPSVDNPDAMRCFPLGSPCRQGYRHTFSLLVPGSTHVVQPPSTLSTSSHRHFSHR
jgi:hypothetical protein